jgi:hypothetical protein
VTAPCWLSVVAYFTFAVIVRPHSPLLPVVLCPTLKLYCAENSLHMASHLAQLRSTSGSCTLFHDSARVPHRVNKYPSDCYVLAPSSESDSNPRRHCTSCTSRDWAPFHRYQDGGHVKNCGVIHKFRKCLLFGP